MSTLLGRIFRRGPRRLPSYNASDAPVRRTPIGKFIHLIALVGSGYCSASLFCHYVLTWGPSAGASMHPTVPSADSWSIISPRYRHGKDLKIGDIVHAKNPILAHHMIAKRVIGMPGDYVLKDEKRRANEMGGGGVGKL